MATGIYTAKVTSTHYGPTVHGFTQLSCLRAALYIAGRTLYFAQLQTKLGHLHRHRSLLIAEDQGPQLVVWRDVAVVEPAAGHR